MARVKDVASKAANAKADQPKRKQKKRLEKVLGVKPESMGVPSGHGKH